MNSTNHCTSSMTFPDPARRTILLLLAALIWGAVAIPTSRAENLLTISGAGDTGQSWDIKKAVATCFELYAPATNVPWKMRSLP